MKQNVQKKNAVIVVLAFLVVVLAAMVIRDATRRPAVFADDTSFASSADAHGTGRSTRKALQCAQVLIDFGNGDTDEDTASGQWHQFGCGNR